MNTNTNPTRKERPGARWKLIAQAPPETRQVVMLTDRPVTPLEMEIRNFAHAPKTAREALLKRITEALDAFNPALFGEIHTTMTAAVKRGPLHDEYRRDSELFEIIEREAQWTPELLTKKDAERLVSTIKKGRKQEGKPNPPELHATYRQDGTAVKWVRYVEPREVAQRYGFSYAKMLATYGTTAKQLNFFLDFKGIKHPGKGRPSEEPPEPFTRPAK